MTRCKIRVLNILDKYIRKLSEVVKRVDKLTVTFSFKIVLLSFAC